MSKLNPKGLIRAVDEFQQSHAPFGFVFGVVKKYGDDQAGSLAALVTYYSFLAIFPLLLVLTTILSLVAGGSHRILSDLMNSALSQFPIIGQKKGPESLQQNIHCLQATSPIGLTVGLAGLVWGSLGASQAAMNAMAQIWNVPKVERPGFIPRTARSLGFLLVLAVFLTLSTVLTGVATVGGSHGALTRVVSIVLSAVVNVALFVCAFRILTPKLVATRNLLRGAVVGALGWTALQSLGSYLVGHTLRHASQLYGFFGIVIGLMWWIYLAVQLTLYVAELNVVHTRRLWPRSIVQPPLTEADNEMLSTDLHEERRRPEQHVSVGSSSRRAHHRGGQDKDTPRGDRHEHERGVRIDDHDRPRGP
jgi:YihY family inner membrane protein